MAKDYSEQIKKYNEELNNNPNDINTLTSLARIYIKENKLNEAEKYYSKILENNSDNTEALYIIGFINMQKNNYKKSIDNFIKLIELGIDNAFIYEYLSIMDKNNRETFLNKSIEKHNKNKLKRKDYERLSYMAYQSYKWKMYDFALYYAELAYTIKQTNDITNLLGCICFYKGEYDKALSYFHELNFNCNKENIYALCNIASCYRKKNSNNMAIKYLDKAKELDDNNKLIYYNIGSIYDKLGNRKSALENFNKAIEIDSDYVEAIEAKKLIYS